MLRIKENIIAINQMIQKIQYFFSSASADDEIEEEKIVSVTAQAVVEIVQERPTKAHDPRKEKGHLKIFWNRYCNN